MRGGGAPEMAVKEQLGDLGCSSVVEHLLARKDKSILWKEVALCSVIYGELTCVCSISKDPLPIPSGKTFNFASGSSFHPH